RRASPQLYTLSLHDALPISTRQTGGLLWCYKPPFTSQRLKALAFTVCSSHIDLDKYIFWTLFLYDNLSKFYSNTNQAKLCFQTLDRKSTRLNSSHVSISYAV